MSGSRSRGWCFTLNNYTEGEEEDIKQVEHEYLIFGHEEAPSTGTQHLQGYIYFKNGKSLRSVTKLLPRSHLEPAKGTPKQNKKYCSKGDNIYEDGEIPEQGHRTDLDQFVESIKEGASDRDLIEEFGVQFLKFYKGVDRMRYSLSEHRTEKPRVFWFWGPAGTGKTSSAVKESKTHLYIKDGTQWWDGYNGTDDICIDDFDGKWPYRDLLRLLDRYEYQGQIKGGYVKIAAKQIFITCEHPPGHFWEDNALAQVCRRIDEIKEICHK